MLAFPKTNVKATGQSYDRRNESTGIFHGHIKEIREIKSESDPTVFGVVDIKADKQPGIFQFFLHYNPDTTEDRPNEPGSSKASRSAGFLRDSAKDLIIACGQTPNSPKAGEEVAWAEKAFNKVEQDKLAFWFQQRRTSRGLDISFINDADEDKPEESATTDPF